MDRTQQRFERFAQLRAAYPQADYEDIMARIHDEEVDAVLKKNGEHLREPPTRRGDFGSDPSGTGLTANQPHSGGSCECICSQGFGMNISCPVHSPYSQSRGGTPK